MEARTAGVPRLCRDYAGIVPGSWPEARTVGVPAAVQHLRDCRRLQVGLLDQILTTLINCPEEEAAPQRK